MSVSLPSDLGSQLRLVAAAGGSNASLGGVRAAMAKAALQLQLDRVEPTPAPVRTVRATGPTLRPARRRSRRYAERGLNTTR